MSGRYLTALTAGVVGILLGLVAPALAQSAHRGIVSLLSAKQTYPPARLIVGTAQRVAWEPYHVRETQSEYYAEHKALYTAQTEGYVAPLLHAEQVTALSGEPGARAPGLTPPTAAL